METNQPQLTEFGKRFMELFCLFIIILWAWKPKKNKTKKPTDPGQLKINFEEPTDQYYDWDQFALVDRLTPDQLRKYPGMNNLTDEEAEKKCNTLYMLSIIGFNTYNVQSDQSIFIIE